MTHPQRFCASRRRPVSTRANLEIKFQRIRLGMPSTLYKSQTNLSAYPCSPLLPPPSQFSGLLVGYLFDTFDISFAPERTVVTEIKEEQEGCPFSGRPDVQSRYRRQYLLSLRKLGTFFLQGFRPSLFPSFFPHSVLSTGSISDTSVLSRRRIVVNDRVHAMRQKRKEGRR